jgi:serine/threonine-protein kinase
MAPAPRIGTEFAGYRIDGLLGRGGMGVVYRAEHPRLGATIALKVMDPERAEDEAFRERFVREARAAAQIKHPNIVPIYDAGEWHGDLYMAMRYIEGDELRSLIRKGGPLSTQQTYVIGAQIASALDAAHRNGLIHRDVKPGNILVEPGPEPDSAPIAYLADLGLTKRVDSQSGVTGSGELLGTIDYIAPEQIGGLRVDGRADVYSLACVLFECLTGTVPYVRENQAAVLWAHLHDDVPRASAVNPTLPPAVDAALARGMAKSPDDRYTTARELIGALQEPLDTATAAARDGAATRPIQSSSPGATAVATPALAPGRRGRRIGVILAAVVGLLLGSAVAAAAVLLMTGDDTAATATVTREAPPTTPEETESPRMAEMTDFDKALLQYVPVDFRNRCQHARPVTDDFDATLSCDPGAPVTSLTYSHAKSGFLLWDYFLSGMTKAGLPSSDPPTLTGLCGSGSTPSVNTTVPAGWSGQAEVEGKAPREQRLGFLRCYDRADEVRMDWITIEPGIYAAATGEDQSELFEWWGNDAGPVP